MGKLSVGGRVAVGMLAFGWAIATADRGGTAPVNSIDIVVEGFDNPGAMTVVDQRILDTRPGAQTGDGRFVGTGRLNAGRTVEIEVTGRLGVADTAYTALANVVAVDPSRSGYLTAFDCALGRPATSNVRFSSGQTVANNAIVGISSGTLCVFASAPTDVIVDLVGTFRFDTGRPERKIDTRVGRGLRRLRAGHRLALHLGRGDENGVMVLSAFAANASASGWLRFGACDGGTWEVSDTSSINIRPGQAAANLVIIADNACVVSSVATDLVVDLVRYGPTRGEIDLPLTPRNSWSDWGPWRVFDSRNPELSGGSPIPAGVVTMLPVYPRFEIAAGRVVNLTVVHPQGDGYLTAFGCLSPSDPPPEYSTINFRHGDVLAHSSVMMFRPDDQICVYSSATTDLVVDIAGAVDRDFEFATRIFHPLGCDLSGELVADGSIGPIPTFERPDGAVGGISFQLLGRDGPFTARLVGPAGWTLQVDHPLHGFGSISWRTPAGTAPGAYPIMLQLTDTAGRSMTITSTAVVQPGPVVVC